MSETSEPKFAYHGTDLSNLDSIKDKGLLVGHTNSIHKQKLSKYDNGKHVFFSNSPTFARAYGEVLLRFPWPIDSKTDLNKMGGPMQNQFVSSKNIPSDSIEIETEKFKDSWAELKGKRLKEDKEFGDYFAGEERKLPKPTNIEPNTDEEIRLIQSIKTHIIGRYPLMTWPAQFVSELLSKGEYPDVFIEPKQKFVYRGMQINIEKYDLLMASRESEFKNGMIFIPQNGYGSSSWTLDYNMAEAFCGIPHSSKIRIILCAKVSDNPNKFLDLKTWYKEVDGRNSNEIEAIGLGKILVDKVIEF